MRDRERIQTKASSIPTNAFNQAETGLFRKRPFVVQAETETDTDAHPLPDLQAQLERGARFNESLSRMKVYGNRPVIQPKIAIGAPGDRYEQEADRVADQVMNMKAPTANPQSVQRQEEEQEAEPMAEQVMSAPMSHQPSQNASVLSRQPISQLSTPSIQASFISFVLKMGAKKATKGILKNFIKTKIKERVKKYLNSKVGKQFLEEADQIMGVLEDPWWVTAIGFIPIVGDAFELARLPRAPVQ